MAEVLVCDTVGAVDHHPLSERGAIHCWLDRPATDREACDLHRCRRRNLVKAHYDVLTSASVKLAGDAPRLIDDVRQGILSFNLDFPQTGHRNGCDPLGKQAVRA